MEQLRSHCGSTKELPLSILRDNEFYVHEEMQGEAGQPLAGHRAGKTPSSTKGEASQGEENGEEGMSEAMSFMGETPGFLVRKH